MSYVRRTSRALAGPPGDEALSHPRRGRELGTVADTGPEIDHWEDRLSSRGACTRRLELLDTCRSALSTKRTDS